MPAKAAKLLAAGMVGTLFLTVPIAGVSAAASSGWFARTWQSDEGLPDNNVTGVAQTPDGYLWVATLGGLVRFDGVHSEELSPAVLPGVPNRVVRALFLDRQGSLWLGMDRGPVVHLAAGGKVRVYTVDDGMPDAHMVRITEDGAGAIWIGYETGMVVRIRDGAVTRFGSEHGLEGEGRCWVTADSDGQLWFARDGRIGVFRDNAFHTAFTLEERQTAIGPARPEGLWIAHGNRVFLHQPKQPLEDRGRLPVGREEVDPTAVFEDRDGALWIGTAANGLFRHDGSDFQRVETSHRAIWCLAQDREGGIWAGTGGGGLNRLRARSVKLWSTEDGVPFEAVQSVCEDSAGRLWVVTENGLLARLDAGVWTELSAEGGWPGGHATCVTADGEGAVWIGTRDGRVQRWVEGGIEDSSRRMAFGRGSVRSLLVCREGHLWIATASPNRLYRLRGEVLDRFDLPAAIRSIRAMAQDEAGAVWIGTADGQLLKAAEDRLTLATPPAGEPFISIRSLHTTEDGSLWIGYAGGGIGRLKGDQFGRVTMQDGLYDNYVSQIVADRQGWLWIGGNRGIFQVRIEHLSDWLEGRRDQVRPIVYGRGEGLPSLQAGFDFFPGSWRGRDGRIWISTRKGLAEIYPERLHENALPPPVWIERVTVDGELLALYDSRSPLLGPDAASLLDLRNEGTAFRLAPEHRRIEFAFAAPSFAAPENVHFRYRLEGFDDDWVEARTQRYAGYPRLPAGEYRFTVLACNHAGVWNDQGASLSFTVLPFFWQTWWFQMSSVGTFTVCIAGLVRYFSFRRLRRRMRQLEQQAALHRERARIAKDIHDDLGASLTQIALLGDLAQQDTGGPGRAGSRIEEISTNARQAIKALDEIVWAVNPGNDTLAHLIDYTAQFAFDYLRLAGIRCRLDLPEAPPEREVATDVRHNLFLVVKEALHNVVKHAQATEVWLRITVGDGALQLEVQDNGCGFDGTGASNSEADGLRNMRQRVAEIGGFFQVQSRRGAGTKIRVEVPWTSRTDRVKRDGINPIALRTP